MKPSLRFLVAITALAVTASSFAWNGTGHMIIAAIAEGRLNPVAYDECIRLLQIGSTPNTKDFIQASCWADDTSTDKTAPWHYINIPYHPSTTAAKTKPTDENVVWAIGHFSDVLKDKSKPDAERADALRYLINFVAEIHQPMHCITMESEAHPDGDRNGMDVPIKTGDLFEGWANPPANLYALWEMGCGIFKSDMEDRPLAQDAEGRIRIAGIDLTVTFPESKFTDQLKDPDPMSWAKESNSTARNIAYTVRTGGGIDLLYITSGKIVANQRAALAGYRLADLLNRLVGVKK